jgi:hypothetical protein
MKTVLKQGMVLHTCNPSTQELRQEDHAFETRPDYITRHYFKKKKEREREREREKPS